MALISSSVMYWYISQGIGGNIDLEGTKSLYFPSHKTIMQPEQLHSGIIKEPETLPHAKNQSNSFRRTFSEIFSFPDQYHFAEFGSGLN